MKKKKIELMKWWCATGEHWVTGGSRYADKNGCHSCWKHTQYLAK